MEKFSQYDIKFAIELKVAGVEKDTLDIITEFGAFEKTTFTSFTFDYISNIKKLNLYKFSFFCINLYKYSMY